MTWMRSLKFKYAVIATSLVVAILLIQSLVTIPLRLNKDKQLTINRARATSDVAATPIITTYLSNKEDVGFQLTKAMRELANNLSLFDQFQIVSMQGEVLYDSQSLKRAGTLPTLKESDIVKAIQSNQSSELTNADGHFLFTPYFDDKGNHQYTVRYALSFQDLENYRQSALAQTIIFMLIFGSATFVLMYLLTQRFVTRPIDQIRSDSNMITTGETDQRIHIKSHDEFGQLAQNLNTMAHTLLDSVKELQEEKAWKNEFIILASHNLRTPLNVIMTSISGIKKDPKISEASMKFVDYIYTRGKELHTLIENLLSISMLKGNKLKAENEPYDLIEVVNTIAKDQETRLREKGLTFTIETRSHHVFAKGDKGQVFQIIDNLVDNAIKFTETGGITIKIDDSKQMITVAVMDTGAGIDEKIVHKLFESFRRGADPLSVDNQGAGLGLYFVKLAVEAQGGEVSIRSKPGKGTDISFTLQKQS